MTTETWVAIASILIPVALTIASGIFGLVGWVLWQLIKALVANLWSEHRQLKEDVRLLREELAALKGFLRRGGQIPSRDIPSPPLKISGDGA